MRGPKARGHRVCRAAAAALLGMLVGCSPSAPTSIGTTYEVKGRVLLADGRPLTNGRVAFLPKDPTVVPASGEVGPDGSFSLTTKTPNDGALPGEYRVRIEPPSSPNPKKPTKPPYPLKYIDEDSSGLVVTVKAESNQLDPIRLR